MIRLDRFLNQHIKVVLNNSSVEGIVISSSKDELILRSATEPNSALIIKNPEENIILIKAPFSCISNPAIKINDVIEEKQISALNLNNAKLVELHELKRKEELESLKQQVTSFEPTYTNTSSYEQPNFTQPNIIQHSSKQDQDSSGGNYSKLRDMFQKRHKRK